jgi:hypothetical protein
MKKLIANYRSFFDVPESTGDNIVIARMITFLVLIFIMGYQQEGL